MLYFYTSMDGWAKAKDIHIPLCMYICTPTPTPTPTRVRMCVSVSVSVSVGVGSASNSPIQSNPIQGSGSDWTVQLLGLGSLRGDPIRSRPWIVRLLLALGVGISRLAN